MVIRRSDGAAGGVQGEECHAVLATLALESKLLYGSKWKKGL